MPGPEIFRGTRLVVDPGDQYVVSCPWCDTPILVYGPEVVDVDKLRAVHQMYHAAPTH